MRATARHGDRSGPADADGTDTKHVHARPGSVAPACFVGARSGRPRRGSSLVGHGRRARPRPPVNPIWRGRRSRARGAPTVEILMLMLMQMHYSS